MINYTIFNQSTVVSTANLQNMVKAMNLFLTTVCNDWGLAPVQLIIGSGGTHPNNSIFLMNDTDVDGALGYHDETAGKAYAKIFARTILNYGGVMLYKDPYTFTVSQVLCHEVLEMLGNNEVSKWYMDNSGTLWAGELCDPVESNVILYTLPGNIKVGMSDYILPNWFAPDVSSRPFNKLNTLSSPFTLDSGGYAIILVISDGYIDTIYGETHQNALALANVKKNNNTSSKMKEVIKTKFNLKQKPS